MSERPAYQVLMRLNNNIEIRRYFKSKWVSTSVDGFPAQQANYRGIMFQKLFNYISGENNQYRKISMTAPVTTVYNSFDGRNIDLASGCRMTMSFFVPSELHNSTPSPMRGDTFVKSESDLIVAVITFGGFASIKDNLYYRDLLIQSLGQEAYNYDTVNFITAGYDAPFKQTNRTNEVWLRKIR